MSRFYALCVEFTGLKLDQVRELLLNKYGWSETPYNKYGDARE